MQKTINEPRVTILCFTYNQNKYIDDALRGFEKQTIFKNCEIIIHDDGSTDGTLGKLKIFKNKYPKQVKLLCSKSNRFSNGDYKFFKESFRACRGDYIALCEGDDYWIDPKKIEMQLDLLDNNSSINLVFHKVEIVFSQKNRKNEIFPELEMSEITKDKLFKNNYIQTNSVMYRKTSYDNMKYQFLPLDWYWHIYHIGKGGIHFINQVMSVYRINNQGVWYESHNNPKKFWKEQYNNHLLLYDAILEMAYNNTQVEYVKENQKSVVRKILNLNLSQVVVEELVKNHSGIVSEYLIDENRKIMNLESSLRFSNNENHKLQIALNSKNVKNELIRLFKKYTRL